MPQDLLLPLPTPSTCLLLNIAEWVKDGRMFIRTGPNQLKSMKDHELQGTPHDLFEDFLVTNGDRIYSK